MPVPNATPTDMSSGRKRDGSGLSRRGLLASLCASAVAGIAGLVALNSSRRPGTGPRSAPTAQARAQGQSLATSEMDGWSRIVGTNFHAAGFDLRLAGVEPLPSVGARPADVTRDRAFLAVFDVRSGGEMPSDLIYSMTSGNHALDIFLTSAATARFPNRMHAVFN